MNKSFKLNEKDEISFSKHEIIITDGAKKRKLFAFIVFCLLMIFGVLRVLKYFKTQDQNFKTQDQYLLWFGLFIGLLYFIILILLLFKVSVKSEISLTKVKSIKFKQIFDRKYLVIKLNCFIIRPVELCKNNKELENYVRNRFGTISN